MAAEERRRRTSAAVHSASLKVLGVDPGTSSTGYGLVERRAGELRLIECGVIRTQRGLTLARKLADIHQGLLEVIDRHGPACVAVEDVFFGRNARTMAVLGHSRGVALMTAALRDVQVAEYPVAVIKKTVVGHGSASKAQVGYMVQKLLRLAEPPSPSDAADGCAAAICHLLHGAGVAAGAKP